MVQHCHTEYFGPFTTRLYSQLIRLVGIQPLRYEKNKAEQSIFRNKHRGGDMMSTSTISKFVIFAVVALSLSACGGRGSGIFGGGGSGIGGNNERRENTPEGFARDYDSAADVAAAERGDTIWDLFRNNDDPNVTLEVNKYLWNASLDVLNFMPIQAADPFTGTISLGYGRPQGGGAAYRATVYITDPALDARSLRVSLQGAGGRAVGIETQRAVEDAILSRARQLRIRDTKL